MIDPVIVTPAPAPVVVAPVVETPVVETPAAPVVVAPVAVLSVAAERIAALRTARAEARAQAAVPVAVDSKASPEMIAAAKRWQSHEASERKRISAASAGLSADDRAIVDGEKDITRAAMLLARLTSTAPAPKAVAPARATGAPPSAGGVDYASTLKDPKAMAEAKAKDPKGFAEYFTSLVRGTSGRKSTLDIARAPKRA
jgi:hypothetical protein